MREEGDTRLAGQISRGEQWGDRCRSQETPCPVPEKHPQSLHLLDPGLRMLHLEQVQILGLVCYGLCICSLIFLYFVSFGEEKNAPVYKNRKSQVLGCTARFVVYRGVASWRCPASGLSWVFTRTTSWAATDIVPGTFISGTSSKLTLLGYSPAASILFSRHSPEGSHSLQNPEPALCCFSHLDLLITDPLMEVGDAL